MPRPQNSFTHLAGVPVHYDRFADARFSYGTRGKPHTFHCTEAFEERLNDAFEELWSVCPLREAEVITTAGAYVNKPGMHGQGRAFDIDGIFWAEKTFVTLNYPDDRFFYLAVEAVLRKHFGTVLNYEYNLGHRDHFHISDRGPVGFVAGHRSRVLFLQMMLTHLFELSVAIDGVMGPETNAAAGELLTRLQLADNVNVAAAGQLHKKLDSEWLALMDKAARKGFERAGAGRVEEENPLQLLTEVYATINRKLEGHPDRKAIETALTAFAQHPETETWLDQFQGSN